MRLIVSSTLFVTATLALAQSHTLSPVPPAPAGTVSGHVFCTDTNEPARFAKVSLERIPDPAPVSQSAAAAKTPAAPKAPMPIAPSEKNIVETALDGSFTLTKVAPGSYYVVVEKEGYINPRTMFSQQEINDPSPAMRALIAEALPRVRIDSTESTIAEVRLQRGAAVSGMILYDDGSPAAELDVKLLHKDASGKWVPLFDSDTPRLGGNIATDDRGYFRVSSLLPDEYIVQADLNLADTKVSTTGDQGHQMMFAMSNYRFRLFFYGAGTPRLSQAASIKLRAGQELTGQDMTIPVARLHHLTGHVAAGPDSHFVNAAELSLITRDDGKELATATISREDGLFHFEYVPDGDYILKVKNARDVVWEQEKPNPGNPFPGPLQDKERVLTAYGDTETPILLSGDLLDTLATVPRDAKPNPSAPAGPAVNAHFNGTPTDGAPAPAPGSSEPNPQSSPKPQTGSTPQTGSAIASLK